MISNTQDSDKMDHGPWHFKTAVWNFFNGYSKPVNFFLKRKISPKPTCEAVTFAGSVI